MSDTLLPPIIPVRRPRFMTFTLFRANPVSVDLVILSDVLAGAPRDLTDLDIAARVFRDFADSGSLVSTKTEANGGITVTDRSQGKIRLQFNNDDLSTAGYPIFIALFVDGTMVDIFGNDVSESPL